MSVHLSWDDTDKTILYYTHQSLWKWPDFYSALQEGMLMQASVDHRVDAIFDLRAAPLIPSNVLWHFQKIINWEQTNLQLLVFVTESILTQKLLSVVDPRSKRFPIAPDPETARRVIWEDRKYAPLSPLEDA